MLKEFWKKQKKLLLTIAIVVLVLAVGCGLWYYLANNSSEPVYVYPFNYIGMTEYWGDSQESYGPVTSDNIQTVYLTDTQTVTEILVQEGDTVKKGDLLMSFDTTLNDLTLERKRLDVEKTKLQLENAKRELQQINSMKPMVIPPEEPETDENLGTALKGEYMISQQKSFDGSETEKALIVWIKTDGALSDAIFEEIRLKAEEYQNYNAENQPAPVEETLPPETVPGETAPEEQPPEPIVVDSFYVVVKATYKNMSLGDRQLWQGLKVSRDGSGGFTFQFVDITMDDHMIAEEDIPEQPEIDYGSGYTAAQIAEMRAQQEKVIKNLEFDVKMAEAEYKIMQKEMDDGNVYAQIDGQVVSLLTPEDAQMMMQPIMKISAGGGFYVEGFISELEKDAMTIGTEVTVNDWNTGMAYTGTIASIGDFPTGDGYWSGMGNPTASYYPFQVFVDGSADLQEGRYVSVMYSASTAENGVYLEKPFIRTEQGKSYVYVQGEDGRLEQRFVQTGKSLWGSYVEILSGVTAEDLIAFPYGKNVKPGAPAVEGDMSNLYG